MFCEGSEKSVCMCVCVCVCVWGGGGAYPPVEAHVYHNERAKLFCFNNYRNVYTVSAYDTCVDRLLLTKKKIKIKICIEKKDCLAF